MERWEDLAGTADAAYMANAAGTADLTGTAKAEGITDHTAYTEYLPEDILRAAGIDGEALAVEEMRFELYELENAVAVEGGELAGMRKKWDGIKRSLRFSLIMLIVFFLLRRLMEIWYREQYVLYQWSTVKSESQLSIMIAIGGSMIQFFRELFYAIDGIFLARFLYKLYEFWRNKDWEISKQWCNWIKKKNLCTEIEQYELRFFSREERLRKLKQARTMYRERKQEEWMEENLPERIVLERELSMEQNRKEEDT